MYLYFTYQVTNAFITISEYTVLLGATTLFAASLMRAFNDIASIKNLCRDADYYLQYIDAMKEKSRISASNELPSHEFSPEKVEIRFENVTFRYPGTDRDVLKNISFVLSGGTRLGIVGENGSGKTTLVKLLTRLYDPTEGKITFNGIDIKEIPYKQYIDNIGVVLQDFTLFAYPVIENIVFDGDIVHEKVDMCLNKSGLSEKIKNMPLGINTPVGKQLSDDGIEFSGGQAQRLAIAKTIYKNCSTLIMDEPTSALDPISEMELFSIMNSIAVGKNAIFISHRLSSTRFCDKIIVLDNGEIVESGTHEALMKKDGLYAKMFNSQAKYYVGGDDDERDSENSIDA